MKTLAFIFLLGLSSQVMMAQNLLKDNSFEKRVQTITVKQGATPPLPCEDFKSKRSSSKKTKTPAYYRYYPKPEAADGEKYASLVIKTRKKDDYRVNAIKLEVCEPLLKDSMYKFAIKVLGEPNVEYKETPFQVLLCSNCKEAEEKGWKKNPYLVQFYPNNEQVTAQKWVTLYGVYRATGGERYLMIYNFKPGKKTKVESVSVPDQTNFMVHIDEVKLYLKNGEINCVTTKRTKKSKTVPKFN